MQTYWCTECLCLEPGVTTTAPITTTDIYGGCYPYWKVGDGWCDDDANIYICNYGGGDCCGGITDYCYVCQCIGGGVPGGGWGTTAPPTDSGACYQPSWLGDGYCDDSTNSEVCQYDGGDCCGSNVNSQYCSECLCLDPSGSGGVTTVSSNDVGGIHIMN